MARKDERGEKISAPLQSNKPISASQSRYDDEHRGPAVSDAIQLSACRIDLNERAGHWPAPANPDPHLVEFAQSVPEDQQAEWLRRQANTEDADRCIATAMRSGELPIWVAPIGEPDRLVAPSAMVEVDHATIVSGIYRPPNDRGWLYGRPLFVKRDDWKTFAARIDAANKPRQPNSTIQSSSREFENRQWLQLRKAVRILHRILRTRLAGQEPAPWIAHPADPFDADCENKAYRHRRSVRTALTLRRALLSGELTAYLVRDAHSYRVPGWAWENASAADNVFFFGRLPLNPLLEHGLAECHDWHCFVSRAEFKTWMAQAQFAEIGDLPTLPDPFDQNEQPSQIACRVPPDRPFVTLTESLTWIAFNISLSRDEFHTMDYFRFGPFAKNDWPDALRAAVANFSAQASNSKIRVRGRYVAYYGNQSTTAHADTAYLTETQLRDFASFDHVHGGLERGTGLAWEKDVLTSALEGPDDGWHDIEVHRADLLETFPGGMAVAEDFVATASTTKAERECRDWLVREFASDPDKKRTKPDFQSSALSHFGARLSARGFIPAWDAVAPNAGRSKPGRKS